MDEDSRKAAILGRRLTGAGLLVVIPESAILLWTHGWVPVWVYVLFVVALILSVLIAFVTVKY